MEMSIFNDLFFYTVAMISGIVLFLVQLVNSKIVITKGWVKWTISWSLSLALTLAAYFCKVLYFATPEFAKGFDIAALLTCIVSVGLVANGIYDIPVIKQFLNKILSVPKFDENGNIIEKK